MRAVPELADQTIVLNGVAKTYAMTGWRVGWMIAPADVTKAAANFQSHLTTNVANVSQRAAIAALEGGLEDVHLMRKAFDRRRTTMVDMLREIDGVVCPTPTGAFYAYPSVEGLIGKTIRGTHHRIKRRPRGRHPRRGRGRRGARRGVWPERLPAPQLRAGRRRPGRGRRRASSACSPRAKLGRAPDAAIGLGTMCATVGDSVRSQP